MIRRLLDLIFPPICELCGKLQKEGLPLCDSCSESLPRIHDPFCQKCGEEFSGQIDESFTCPNCDQIDLAFEFARSPLGASLGARKLVHSLKYRRRFFLSDTLARFLLEALENDSRLKNLPFDTLLVPVPLHWHRQQKRQGNQAYEIAQSFAKLSGLPLSPVLKRTRHTQTQTCLTRKERLTNLKGAFLIRPKQLPEIKDATILLIDDVFTTGATAHECTKVLLKTGKAKRVIVLTLMRG
ncbi:MAG: ComF family protein [Akkermansiaceae bacterium]